MGSCCDMLWRHLVLVHMLTWCSSQGVLSEVGGSHGNHTGSHALPFTISTPSTLPGSGYNELTSYTYGTTIGHTQHGGEGTMVQSSLLISSANSDWMSHESQFTRTSHVTMQTMTASVITETGVTSIHLNTATPPSVHASDTPSATAQSSVIEPSPVVMATLHSKFSSTFRNTHSYVLHSSPGSNPEHNQSMISLETRLVLYIVPPLGVVILFVLLVTFVLCCRRYHRMYRVRQHLMPLTNMEGVEDSDDESLDDQHYLYQINSTNLSNISTRPVLAFSEDEEY